MRDEGRGAMIDEGGSRGTTEGGGEGGRGGGGGERKVEFEVILRG